MLVPTLIMAALALALIVVAHFAGKQATAFNASWRMLLSLMPLLIFAFLVAGYVQVLLPQDKVASWLGAEAGVRGILLGTIGGAICPGGPFVSMPIAAGLLGAGSGIGTMVAFMTSWSLLGVHRLPMEVGILGWRFAMVRYGISLVLPVIAGLVARAIFDRSMVV